MPRLEHWLSALAVAINLVAASPRSGVRDLYLRQSSDEQCIPNCEIGSCSGGTCLARRGIDQLGLPSQSDQNVSLIWPGGVDATLEKRLFTLVSPYDSPDRESSDARLFGRIQSYVSAQLRGQSSRDTGYDSTESFVLDNEACIVRQARFRDDGRGVFEGESPRNGQKLQLGTSGLSGCMMVTMVTNEAVWMAHFWESYSNGLFLLTVVHDTADHRFHLTGKDQSGNKDTPPPGGFPDPDDPDDAAFQQRVMDVMRGQLPVTSPATNDHRQYLSPVGSFGNDAVSENDDYIKPQAQYFNRKGAQCHIFVQSPTPKGAARGATDFRYPNKMVYLQGQLMNLFPSCKIFMKPYDTLNTNSASERRLLDTAKEGTHLFQWDPDFDGNGNAGWRIFCNNWQYRYPTDYTP